MKRAIITVDLGFGDSGKGAWVDYLTREYEAELVIRYSGGSQCGHNVQLPNGHRHTFSQLGAGTFAGARTYLGPAVIVNPYALEKEKKALYEAGVNDVASLLWIHPKCLITTIFHQWMNKLKELSRAEDPNDRNRHGSCGHGIGETRSYWLKYGDDAIFATDLQYPHILEGKLQLLRQRLLLEAGPYTGKLPNEVVEKYNIYALNTTHEAMVLGRLALSNMMLCKEPPRAETVIFEGAQGVLLDEYHGFHPYTTWSTVGPHHALEMAYELGIEECCLLGLTRSYTTRHGAGPLPTYCPELTAKLPDPGNPANPWQGGFRCGYLDLPLLKYAVDACGGKIDGLLVSHLDQYPGKVCTAHHRVPRPYLGEPDQVGPFTFTASPIPNPDRQESLGRCLMDLVQPVYEEMDAPTLQQTLNDKIGLVVGAATGPTHAQRDLTDLPFRKRVD